MPIKRAFKYSISNLIDKFDGEHIYSDGEVIYELGNFLGRGASGSVYLTQCRNAPGTKFAMKVLDPLGYVLLPPNQLVRCRLIHQGIPPLINSNELLLKEENITWLFNPLTKQYIAAYEVNLT